MKKGDHIYVDRGWYTHHGIYEGNGRVIHYTGEPGAKSRARVTRSSIDEFAQGGKIQVEQYDKCLPAGRTVRMARSRLRERKYNLLFNNCEHFARYCKTGKKASRQVRKATAAASTAALIIVIVTRRLPGVLVRTIV